MGQRLGTPVGSLGHEGKRVWGLCCGHNCYHLLGLPTCPSLPLQTGPWRLLLLLLDSSGNGRISLLSLSTSAEMKTPCRTLFSDFSALSNTLSIPAAGLPQCPLRMAAKGHTEKPSSTNWVSQHLHSPLFDLLGGRQPLCYASTTHRSMPNTSSSLRENLSLSLSLIKKKPKKTSYIFLL